MITTEDLADPIRKLGGREHHIGLDHPALAVDPLRLYRVEPRALLGKKAGHTMRTPLPRSLTSRLWAAIYPLTSLDLCQEALSQTNSGAFLPNSSSFRQLHERNCVVMALTAGGHRRTAARCYLLPAQAGRARSTRGPSGRG